MKKLLSLFGAIGLVASTGVTSVVSCDKDKAEKIDLGTISVSVDKDNKAFGGEIVSAIEEVAQSNKDAIKYMSDHPIDTDKVADIKTEVDGIGSLSDSAALEKSYDISSVKFEKMSYTGTDGKTYTIEYDFTLSAKTE